MHDNHTGRKAEMLLLQSGRDRDLRRIKEFQHILEMSRTREYVSSDVTLNGIPLLSFKKKKHMSNL